MAKSRNKICTNGFASCAATTLPTVKFTASNHCAALPFIPSNDTNCERATRRWHWHTQEGSMVPRTIGNGRDRLAPPLRLLLLPHADTHGTLVAWRTDADGRTGKYCACKNLHAIRSFAHDEERRGRASRCHRAIATTRDETRQKTVTYGEESAVQRWAE